VAYFPSASNDLFGALFAFELQRLGVSARNEAVSVENEVECVNKMLVGNDGFC
jgi:hypothetical protein